MTHFLSKKQILIGIFAFLSTGSSYAALGHFYLEGTTGVSLSKLDHANPRISYDNGIFNDAYPLHGNQSNRMMMSGNIGYELTGSNGIPSLALGVGLFGTPTDYSYTGHLIETPLGDTSNTLYNYRFNVNSIRLMAEAQLSWTIGNIVPFINGGIGSAWNRLSGYNEIPVASSGFVALPPFQSHTNTNFAYQVGVGLGYGFNFAAPASAFKQERVSLGYRYANLGTASFKTRGQVYPYPLNFGKIQSNEIYLSYTHLFQ